RDGTSLVHIEVGFAGDAAQVMGSYYASWLVVDTLERRYGSAGMLRFLEALARGDSLAAALRAAFGLSPEDFDRAVLDALR
ncbi:MAG: hypothetical protein HYY26_07495, partial [Acidobacteria bacterium]|nr:hypothetical protein [Acidobacteriota bacterium]